MIHWGWRESVLEIRLFVKSVFCLANFGFGWRYRCNSSFVVQPLSSGSFLEEEQSHIKVSTLRSTYLGLLFFSRCAFCTVLYLTVAWNGEKSCNEDNPLNCALFRCDSWKRWKWESHEKEQIAREFPFEGNKSYVVFWYLVSKKELDAHDFGIVLYLDCLEIPICVNVLPAWVCS